MRHLSLRLGLAAGAILLSAGAADLQGQVVPFGSISGSVRDSAGRAVAGAEVSIADLKRRTVTAPNGTFRLDSVMPGRYAVRARKIGFTPEILQISVDSSMASANFSLAPSAQALPPIVSVVSRKGLWGHVDELGRGPLAGAHVEVLGTGRGAFTDANGDFHVALLRGGRYMVSIARDSFTTKVVGVRIPDDSGRNITSQLQRAAGKLAADQFWIIPDLKQRQAWIVPGDRVLYTREDLEALKIEWIYDAVDMAGPQLNAREHYDRDCSVVVNGGPRTATLSKLTVDDVESVEVYQKFVSNPAYTAAQPKSKKSKWKKSPPPAIVNNFRIAAQENFGRYCPAVFVWLR